MLTMTPEEAARRERERRILSDGISEEALALLKRQFRYDRPAFQFLDTGSRIISHDAHTLALMAATRDGEHCVINWIETVRNRTPENLLDYGH